MVLCAAWVIIAFFSILKGGEGGSGVVECGSWGYWLLVFAPIPLVGAIVWNAGNELADRCVCYNVCGSNTLQCVLQCTLQCVLPPELSSFTIALQPKVHYAVQYICIGPHCVPNRNRQRCLSKNAFPVDIYV